MNPVQMPASNALSQPLSSEAEASHAWHDAELAAALVAVLRHKAGGMRVCAQPGPVRDHWLALLDSFTKTPARRVPITHRTPPGRHGYHRGMRHGKPVFAQGVLAERISEKIALDGRATAQELMCIGMPPSILVKST